MFFLKWLVSVLTTIGASFLTLGVAGLLFEEVAKANAYGAMLVVAGWVMLVIAGGIASVVNARDKGG